MTHDYQYNLSQTLHNQLNSNRLTLEIQKSEIIISLDSVNFSNATSIIDIRFKAELSPENKTVLDQIVSSHDGTITRGTTAPVTSDHKPRVQIDPREGSSYNSPSINWCDKTTWFVTSTREIDVELDVVSDSENKIWETPTDTVWVDVCHGKITGERNFRDQYKPLVKVDGIEKSEITAENLIGDYTVNYREGKITFESSVDPNSLVQATFSCVKDSSWNIVPSPGKKLDIVAVEVQFSSDVEMTDTIIFSVWGIIDYFAPHLVSETPNGVTSFPSGIKIPLKKYFYQTMDDFVNDSQRSYTKIPKLGGDGWRGMKTDQYIFRWPYYEESVRRLHSHSGMELRVTLEHNIELSGNKALCTMYGVSEDE